jgi:hypothetical protein
MDLAAVAPGSARAAEIGLEDHDARLRRPFLDPQRGPEAGETAADNGDIGMLGALQRLGRRIGVDVLKPEGAVRRRGDNGRPEMQRHVTLPPLR